MLPKVDLNFLSFRDVTLEQGTFKVSVFRLLYLKEKVLFLVVGSMIVFVEIFCISCV